MHRNAAHASVITGPWQSSATAAATPGRPERRKAAPLQNADALRAGLTPAQLVTLEALEITRHVVIQEDGTLDESQSLVLRA